MVRADIARFYHSIYTHSIPWALHGKEIAKQRRHDNRLLGNRLDRALRNAADGQTMGIAIGPDTSLVMAEIILTQVDRNLQKRMPQVSGHRYVDDFEIAALSHDEAEHVVAVLQQLLADFELELNSLKTEIVDLPAEHDTRWAAKIRSLPLSRNAIAQANDLIRLFDGALLAARKNPNAPILRYLMGRLARFAVHPQNWELYQHLLFGCMTTEPATLQGAMSTLLRHLERGFSLDRDTFASTLNRLIEVHAPLGHSNEVAWAVWSLVVLRLPVTGAAVNALNKIDDDVVTLLFLHAADLKLLEADLNIERLMGLVGELEEALYDEHWLLAYEATVRGWLPLSDVSLRRDKSFGYLAGLGIRFYDLTGAEHPKPTGVAPSIGVAPAFYP